MGIREKRVASRIRNFVNQNTKIIGLIGALIVFITFIVKDALRDQLKDLVGAIDSAENVYLAQEGTALMASDLEELKKDAERLQDVVEGSAGSGHNSKGNNDIYRQLDDVRDWLSLAIQEYEIASTYVDNARRLLKKIPNHPALAGRLQELDTALSSLRIANMRAAEVIAERQIDIMKSRERLADDVVKQLQNQTSTLVERSVPLAADAGRFADDASKEAEKDREKYERLYGLCNWISYLLYTIGWGLAFVGRVYEVRELQLAE